MWCSEFKSWGRNLLGWAEQKGLYNLPKSCRHCTPGMFGVLSPPDLVSAQKVNTRQDEYPVLHVTCVHRRGSCCIPPCLAPTLSKSPIPSVLGSHLPQEVTWPCERGSGHLLISRQEASASLPWPVKPFAWTESLALSVASNLTTPLHIMSFFLSYCICLVEIAPVSIIASLCCVQLCFVIFLFLGHVRSCITEEKAWKSKRHPCYS